MPMYNGLPVLSVSLRKGGVGKTLFAVLLSQYFGHVAKNKRKVLLIDLDTQQNASESVLEMDGSASAGDHKVPPVHPDFDESDPETDGWNGISSSADIFHGDDPIIAPYPTRFENLDVLPAVGAALQAVEMVRSEEVKEMIYERLKDFFSDADVQDAYDLVIIDTPPGKGAINRSVLRAVTHVLYPVVPEEKPMNGLRGMLQFERTERRYRDEPINVVGVVPNMVNIQTTLHRDNLDVLREDPIIGPLLTEFYIGERIAFPTIDKPNISPDTIWKFKNYPEARHEAYELCEFVEKKLFGSEAEKVASL